MRTIIDYLETEFATFEEKPFNAVDSLILAEFCMVRAEGVVEPMRDVSVLETMGVKLLAALPAWKPKRRKIHFRDMLLAERYEAMFAGLEPHLVKELMLALAASPRFRDMELREYAAVFNEQEATQFAAFAFVYKNQFAYLGFRGTDVTFTGWREDFNMAYMHPVPSQAQAVRYVETVASRMPARLILGGHSKGGNLAVYAGAKAAPAVRERIERIYNHDGPGFREGVLSSAEADVARGLVDKTVPQESVVGMLMHDSSSYRVVHSNGKGIMQHSPFTWEVNAEGTDFGLHANGLTPAASFVDVVIDEWLSRYDEREARLIVDALFDVMESSGAQDFSAFLQGGVKTLSLLKDAAAKSSEESRDVLMEAAGALSEVVVRKAFSPK